MNHFLEWLADVLLGPLCPAPKCGYRARGHRTLKKHGKFEHPGLANG